MSTPDNPDLRCRVWCLNDYDSEAAQWCGTEYVPATRRVFSCWPEARAYADTISPARSPIVVPLMLVRSIVEYYRVQEDYAADEDAKET